MSSTFKVRNFIKAKSEKRLRLLMFQKQTELQMTALEFDQIYYDGKNHIAWYYEVLKNNKLEEIINVDTKDK